MDSRKRKSKVNDKNQLACYKCGEKDHLANTCKGKRKSVNFISQIDETIKEDTIYFFDFKFSLLVDTGSSFNFITQKIIRKLKLKTNKIEPPIKLYTCLLTPFYIEEKIRLRLK